MEAQEDLHAAHLLAPTASAGALLSLPYARRQAIVIVDHRVLEAEFARARAEAEDPGPESLLDKLMSYRPEWLSKEVHVDQPEDETAQAVAALHENGRRIMLVSYQQAECLDLPVGHPLEKVVYIGDPASPNVYTPAADFHRKTFEHKFSEAILLLMALGASKLAVHAREGWGRDFAGELDLPIPQKLLTAAPRGKSEQRKDASLLFTASLTPHKPKIPPGLVWYPREPTWRQVAVGRMKYGLREFALNVRYADDYGINTSFESGVKKAKLKLGGKFKRATETDWQIEGTFGS